MQRFIPQKFKTNTSTLHSRLKEKEKKKGKHQFIQDRRPLLCWWIFFCTWYEEKELQILDMFLIQKHVQHSTLVANRDTNYRNTGEAQSWYLDIVKFHTLNNTVVYKQRIWVLMATWMPQQRIFSTQWICDESNYFWIFSNYLDVDVDVDVRDHFQSKYLILHVNIYA